MMQIMKVLSMHVRQYLALYVFTSLLFIVGVIFGSIIVNSMTFIQKQEVYYYVEQFFTNMQDDLAFENSDILKRSFFSHLQYLFFFFLFGLTIIGIPFIWLFLFMKGLFIGFSVGFTVNQLGWHGLFISLVSIAPQNIIIVPVYLVAATIAMIVSIRFIQQIIGKNRKLAITQLLKQYIALYCVCIAFAFFGSLIETYVSQSLLKIIL